MTRPARARSFSKVDSVLRSMIGAKHPLSVAGKLMQIYFEIPCRSRASGRFKTTLVKRFQRAPVRAAADTLAVRLCRGCTTVPLSNFASRPSGNDFDRGSVLPHAPAARRKVCFIVRTPRP